MKKIKVYDYDGTKIDTAIIKDKKDVKKALERWRLKGLW